MTDLWTERARTYGRRSVVGLPIAELDLDQVTASQASILFPLLRLCLSRPVVDRAMDFGAGYGRFSKYLWFVAKEIVCYDPCDALFKHAPKLEGVSYETGPPETFLAGRKNSFDLIWVCHVFGGIAKLEELFPMIAATLKPRGLMFAADNVSDTPVASDIWQSRTEGYYLDLFRSNGIPSNVVGHYAALGNPMSVFAGVRSA